MKILFLLPPSEGKNSGGIQGKEKLSFSFEKPIEIAENATEKDLKCKDKRYEEGVALNKNIMSSDKLPAIERYSGVMYNAIDYEGMSDKGKDFFNSHFLIFSGMYGMVSPQDIIGDYKLPIETKGLYQYWWDIVPEAITSMKPDYIVNLLPISYAKMIGLSTDCNRHKKKLEPILNVGTKVININFLKPDGKKISHGVKKIKGQWIKDICDNGVIDFHQFGGKVVENGPVIDVNIVS